MAHASTSRRRSSGVEVKTRHDRQPGVVTGFWDGRTANVSNCVLLATTRISGSITHLRASRAYQSAGTPGRPPPLIVACTITGPGYCTQFAGLARSRSGADQLQVEFDRGSCIAEAE